MHLDRVISYHSTKQTMKGRYLHIPNSIGVYVVLSSRNFQAIPCHDCVAGLIALIAQWLERMDQEAGGPGFDLHHHKLSGLQVRPFKVSGGSPRPPPEQTPGNRVKNLKEKTR